LNDNVVCEQMFYWSSVTVVKQISKMWRMQQIIDQQSTVSI
jgi:hypothetical protein